MIPSKWTRKWHKRLNNHRIKFTRVNHYLINAFTKLSYLIDKRKKNKSHNFKLKCKNSLILINFQKFFFSAPNGLCNQDISRWIISLNFVFCLSLAKHLQAHKPSHCPPETFCRYGLTSNQSLKVFSDCRHHVRWLNSKRGTHSFRENK